MMRRADMRYVGQEHALQIAVDGPEALTGNVGELARRFHAEHDKRYGQAASEESLEIVNIRLVVTAERADSMAATWLTAPWVAEEPAEERRRDVIFTDAAKPVSARILWRPSLPAGFTFEGPAVIEEPNSTILIYPGDRVTVEASGHLVVDLAGV